MEILPSIEEPRTRFRTLVAMNVLGILERELRQGETFLRCEHGRLARLLGRESVAPGSVEELSDQVVDMNRDLARLIRLGEVPSGTLTSLKRTVTEKLTVASPRYLERYADEA
ncbi:DUF6285 domain-containing protein [Rubrobacter radiotolerans]|uniref:DUF6285 domain-containing protein n=1 Tax=Rubrobacter radiotolerans TaxID=42256 RepID=A0AB35SYG4_RUBRA|nr:DUF6285 domain-containing protein [Rubrobacter radiotolerans]MDX5892525.1 DUF6285 domain-containing protein [Rubrobacter radiotolerans]